MKIAKNLLPVVIGFFIALIVFGGSVFFTYQTVERLITDFKDIEDTHSIVEQTKSILNDLLKLESDVRGFAVNKNETYVKDYMSVKHDLMVDIDNLQQFVTPYPNISAKVKNFRGVLEEKLLNLEEKIALIKDEKNNDQKISEKIDQSSLLMAKIFDSEREVENEVKKILQAKHDLGMSDLKLGNLTIQLISSSALMIVVFVFVFFFQFARAHSKIEKELRDLNENKNKFFSIISHDLRNPVKQIALMAGFLTDQASSKNYDPQKLANMIQGSANNLSSLLDNLLKWSRLQMNQIDFKPEKLDIKKIADDVIRHTNVNASQKGIIITNKIQGELIAFVDQNMITTVLRNLFSNGIKFTNKNGSIELDALLKNDMIELKVSDNGVGMPQDIADKIFSIDFRHSTKGTNKEEGSGLGLKICKEFIEKNGGKIRIQSELNKGTTFIITLPQKANV
ncbi:MAG: ATP-binding protein [Bacteroidota bacterium]|nr:ATP-binding protein [Bacteroidota bacterium]